MKSLIITFGKKKRIVLFGILLMVNIVLFSLPGMPANISKVIQKSPEVQIPDMRLGYSANELFDFLTLIGPEGRQAYQWMHLTTDLAFPIIYGLFFFSTSSYLLVQVGMPTLFIAWFGVFAAVFDLAENFTLLFITNRYPEFLSGLANLARLFTLGKFTFILTSFVIIGLLIVINRRQSKQSS